MTHCSLLDPTAVCHHPDTTDIHDPAHTTCHLVPLLQMYLLLSTGLHYQLTDTQVCLCLDPWEESLDLDPPTDMHSTPGLALDMSWIPGVHLHPISVPHHLITLDRCFHHMVCLYYHQLVFIFRASSVCVIMSFSF